MSLPTWDHLDISRQLNLDITRCEQDVGACAEDLHARGINVAQELYYGGVSSNVIWAIQNHGRNVLKFGTDHQKITEYIEKYQLLNQQTCANNPPLTSRVVPIATGLSVIVTMSLCIATLAAVFFAPASVGCAIGLGMMYSLFPMFGLSFYMLEKDKSQNTYVRYMLDSAFLESMKNQINEHRQAPLEPVRATA